MTLKLTVEYSILDASSYEIRLVEVADIILYHQQREFKMKEKKIVGDIRFRHREGLAECQDDYVG